MPSWLDWSIGPLPGVTDISLALLVVLLAAWAIVRARKS
jgi:hypothetical protein